MRIVTSHQYPPIPMKEFDWAAYFEGEEDGLVGYGPTEKAALADLLSQVADSSVHINQQFWDAYRAAMDKATDWQSA
jgi:hypothetical protein